MKKLAKILLVGALALGSLQAKELFNLKAQDFEHTLGGKSKNAKYKVNDDVIVETNLLKRDYGYYRTNEGHMGYFNIALEKSVTNFTFNSDIVYNSTVRLTDSKVSPNYDTGTYEIKRQIKFTDINGKMIILEFHRDGFNINGKEYKASIDLETIALEVTKKENKLSIKINNSNLYDEQLSFNNLKYIDVSVLNFLTNGTRGRSAFDKLNNIILVENE